MAAARDLWLATKAKAYGANYSLRIVLECRRAGLPVSLGFALIEQESGFRNVWGHDPAPNGVTSLVGGYVVTKARYAQYKRARGPKGAGGMQGVGPAQLTWWSYQDAADSFGGCWKPKHNIRVAFAHLAFLIHQLGDERHALQAYNGSGQRAVTYAASVLDRKAKWHRRLT